MVKLLARGIEAEGRAKSYKRRALWAVKKKNGGKFPLHPKQVKDTAVKQLTKFYPPEDVKQPIKKRVIRQPTKLRSSITPGTVLILLAGRFKGKRVVFLKQLASGLLLVTGPFKLNGVPLRRVNQAYVIATSTKIDVSRVDVTGIEDVYFKTEQKRKNSKDGEGEFFEQEKTKKELPAEYVEKQKAVDAGLLIKLDDTLKAYLSSRFSLKDGDRPHLMKF